MADEYDIQTAIHYAAYRPPIHKLILDKCIRSNVDLGLDVGCGTGHSSIALADYCKQVIGTDPSGDMITKAIPHPSVEYQICDGRSLAFLNDTFERITFAGSLYYAKSQELLNEVLRVSRHGTQIIIYDFEVLLDQILVDLKIDPADDGESLYNHQENFSGLAQDHLEAEINSNEIITIKVDSSDLAHLILSVKDHRKLLSNKYGDQNLFEKVKGQLSRNSGGGNYNLSASVYYSIYRCRK